jgi:hypothetical protein
MRAFLGRAVTVLSLLIAAAWISGCVIHAHHGHPDDGAPAKTHKAAPAKTHKAAPPKDSKPAPAKPDDNKDVPKPTGHNPPTPPPPSDSL